MMECGSLTNGSVLLMGRSSRKPIRASLSIAPNWGRAPNQFRLRAWGNFVNQKSLVILARSFCLSQVLCLKEIEL